MIKTHYVPMYQPDANCPKIIGYNVWAYIGHPLLGKIQGTNVFVKTKRQAQQEGKKIRDFLSEEPYDGPF